MEIKPTQERRTNALRERYPAQQAFFALPVLLSRYL